MTQDRPAFAAGCLWGTATSAHQVEGGNANNDWSDLEKQPGRIRDGTASGDACRWWSGAAEEDSGRPHPSARAPFRDGRAALCHRERVHDMADATRPGFLVDHVAAVREAITRGADVRGYFHWSLVDNFEWAGGWQPRFGLIEVDRLIQKRTLRPSALVYERICRSNGAAPPAKADGARRRPD